MSGGGLCPEGFLWIHRVVVSVSTGKPTKHGVKILLQRLCIVNNATATELGSKPLHMNSLLLRYHCWRLSLSSSKSYIIDSWQCCNVSPR